MAACISLRIAGGTGVCQQRLSGYATTSLAVLGSSLLTGTSTKGVFVSTDNGANWTQATASTASILSLAVSGTKVFGGDTGRRGGGLLRHRKELDSGGLGTADVRALAVTGRSSLPEPPGRGSGSPRTMGRDWSRSNTGLADSNVFSLGVSGANLFAGVGSGGVWKRSLSELIVGVSVTSTETPIVFELLQNYPNPVNPTTVVSCQLPVASKVGLSWSTISSGGRSQCLRRQEDGCRCARGEVRRFRPLERHLCVQARGRRLRANAQNAVQ